MTIVFINPHDVKDKTNKACNILDSESLAGNGNIKDKSCCVGHNFVNCVETVLIY